jgi:hypothetical protein
MPLPKSAGGKANQRSEKPGDLPGYCFFALFHIGISDSSEVIGEKPSREGGAPGELLN